MISGGCSPASIAAICRANPDVEKAGSCRGTEVVERARDGDLHPWSGVGFPTSSCASLLKPYGPAGMSGCVFGQRLGRRPVDERRARDQHARLRAGSAEPVEQMMRAAHVGRERRFRAFPRLADMSRAGAVIHGRGLQARDRIDHRRSIQKIDSLPPIAG